jgi:hypothetical protein
MYFGFTSSADVGPVLVPRHAKKTASNKVADNLTVFILVSLSLAHSIPLVPEVVSGTVFICCCFTSTPPHTYKGCDSINME